MPDVMHENTALIAAATHTLVALGWAIDRRDWPGVAALLADDVDADYTRVFGGQPMSMPGRDLAAQWEKQLGRLAATQHLVTGVRASIADDGTVHATANVVGTHVGTVGGPDSMWTIGGWWDTRLTPHADSYRARAITLHPSWQTGDIAVVTGDG